MSHDNILTAVNYAIANPEKVGFKHNGDRVLYTDSKTDFILGVINKLIQKSKVELRKYHPDDCEVVWELFYNTIHSVNSEDYTDSQLDAWASKEIDLYTWNERLQRNDYAVVAELNDVIVGIGTADDAGYFDLLYVHKDYQRIGIATLISDNIENYLWSKGAQVISTDASITAKPFFEKRGYVVQMEQSVKCRGQYLTNFKMQNAIQEDAK